MKKRPFVEYHGNQTTNRSLDEAASEVTREIDVRRRLYDKWVNEGRMTWVDAHDRLERMLCALQFLTGYRHAGDSIEWGDKSDPTIESDVVTIKPDYDKVPGKLPLPPF